jgi:hypothetical protein
LMIKSGRPIKCRDKSTCRRLKLIVSLFRILNFSEVVIPINLHDYYGLSVA